MVAIVKVQELFECGKLTLSRPYDDSVLLITGTLCGYLTVES